MSDSSGGVRPTARNRSAGEILPSHLRTVPMRRRLKQLAAVLACLLILAQLVRPGRENPPIDEALTIQASSTELGAILDRACRDCHSNATVWSWYTQVAPLSWLMAYGVREGRRAVNFSVWATYTPEQQRALLAASCEDATAGKMPGSYALLKPDTRLSAQDVETICSAARRATAAVGEGR